MPIWPQSGDLAGFRGFGRGASRAAGALLMRSCGRFGGSIAGPLAPAGGRRLAAAVVVAWAAQVAWAVPADDHVSFQRFSPRDGLPAAAVNGGLQDSRGFLWFATGDGLTRFDGHRFRTFRPDPADPASLGNGVVVGMQEDARGDLWLATEGGVDVWRRSTERFSHFRHDAADPGSLGDDSVQCLLADPDGAVWVGTRRGGLDHFDPATGKFERVGPASETAGGVSDEWIRCLFRDRAGRMWIGTEGGGLNRLDPTTRRFQVYAHHAEDPHSLSGNRVSAIAEDAAGALWIGTDGGLCRFEPERGTFDRVLMDRPEMNIPPIRTVAALLADKEGRIWIGTDGGGLTRYDPASGRFTHHRRSRHLANSLASDAVRTLFADRSGDLWVGHFPAAVSHFDRSAAAFQVFTSGVGEGNTMSDDQVLSFWADASGDLWVGTDNGGLNHWNAASGQWTSFEHSPRDPHSLGGKAAVSLLRDSRGVLWIGTWDGGLNRFDPATGSFDRFLPEPGRTDTLADGHVWQMAEDQAHRLWLCTIGGGLDCYLPDENRFIHHRHDPANPRSIPDDIVCSVLVSHAGAIWVGTPKGLARLDAATQTWDRFQSRPGERATLNNYWIFDLLEDREGVIWATTEGGGLNRLDPRTGECENFRTRDGLGSDALRGILQDQEGVLWIGSNHGLMRFDPRTRQVRVFDETNGLPGSQFNPHARLKLDNGEFLFGTTEGFVRFDPRALATSAPPVPVVLTQLDVFNEVVRPGQTDSPLSRSITETRQLVVPARLSVLGFEFAALGYRSAARTRFRVQLEGFDRNWRDLEGEHRATFTNLDPGRYRLRVQATAVDGGWTEPGVSLDLAVVPPWWQTWWFKSAIGLLVLGSAAAVGWAISAQRSREAQRKRELAVERERVAERERAAEALRVLNHELERRVTDRTAQLAAALKELEAFNYSVSHDLRAPLRAVNGFSALLLEQSGPRLDETGQRHLSRIRAASERMGQLIDALLTLSRVSRGEMHRGRVDLSALAGAIAGELRQENPAQHFEFVIAPNLVADGDARLLQIVMTNLLGNAAKFSSNRPVARIEFGATMRDGAAAFFVRDNGAGFNMAYAPKLFGAFQRLHSEAEFPGTGVGLATVQRIIQRHGGRISADAEPDRGATFYFSLPLGGDESAGAPS